jgi:3-(3-hydroxy-phenyl)propionate hydroxylase
MASTATPRLRHGALRGLPARRIPALRAGALIPNPLVSAGGPPVRLDTILAGRAAVLTAREPDEVLAEFCDRHHLLLVRVSASTGTDPRAARAGTSIACQQRCAALQALIDDPALLIVVRPDRVIAASERGSRLPRLPWRVRSAGPPGSAISLPVPAIGSSDRHHPGG